MLIKMTDDDVDDEDDDDDDYHMMELWSIWCNFHYIVMLWETRCDYTVITYFWVTVCLTMCNVPLVYTLLYSIQQIINTFLVM